MFNFKQFSLYDEASSMKIGTDGVLLGAWAFSDYTPRRVVDVGCGTALISLMLAQRFPKAHIAAVEIDGAAASEARGNVVRSPWSDRVAVEQVDFNLWRGQVDAVVSNPPFFSTGQRSPLESRALARHEDLLSVESVILRSASLLPEGGRMALIAPAERADEIIYRSTMARLDPCRVTAVAHHRGGAPVRVMVECVKGIAPYYINDSLTLLDGSGRRTPRYHQLTCEFYLDSK